MKLVTIEHGDSTVVRIIKLALALPIAIIMAPIVIIGMMLAIGKSEHL